MTKNSFFEKIVHFTAENIPFIFLIDFEKNKPQLFSFQEALENGIYVNIKGKGNFQRATKDMFEGYFQKQYDCSSGKYGIIYD